ncbi:hypothetical protein DPMN_140469 [Dreissena polymorpha]|uniref:Uncharacterized protein n=1 Tax=Dreissena polymorpha TaxID=45954 RepID=A0A9D4G7S7_DREPO|nr:hypothetical protein DPMN_140469 [Dreissena polymorpha]
MTDGKELGQRYRQGFRGGCRINIIAVSRDGGNQYAQLAGIIVLGFGPTACGV